MNQKDFKKIVLEALENLPDFFKQKMENISIVVKDKPAPEELKHLKSTRKEILLGLYSGIPLADRGQSYGMVLPDKITLFKKNIESICSTEEQLKKRIIHTVQHEIAHHFGITDEELIKWGKY